MFFNVFLEVFISTKYDEAIEACKAELQDQVNTEALIRCRRRRVRVDQRRQKISLQS